MRGSLKSALIWKANLVFLSSAAIYWVKCKKLFSIPSSQFLSWMKRTNSCPLSTLPINMKWYTEGRSAMQTYIVLYAYICVPLSWKCGISIGAKRLSGGPFGLIFKYFLWIWWIQFFSTYTGWGRTSSLSSKTWGDSKQKDHFFGLISGPFFRTIFLVDFRTITKGLWGKDLLFLSWLCRIASEVYFLFRSITESLAWQVMQKGGGRGKYESFQNTICFLLAKATSHWSQNLIAMALHIVLELWGERDLN